jgi:BCCT family betaine/carnitine transporter
VNKWPGKVIDIVFIIALVCGAATSLGVGIPMVTAAICSLFGIQETMGLNVVIMLITTALFGLTGFLGLKKGIAKLSNINMVLAFLILLIVLVFGPTKFIMKMFITSVGYLAQNYVRMSTWLDPVGNGGFPESWTQFYWAWFMAYAPFMGLFIARISRGRTLRNVLLGGVAFGGLGCMVFFWILGNFQMDLMVSGKLDIAAIIADKGASTAIMEGFRQIPLGIVVIALYAVCGIVFLATTFNSVSYSIAAVSMKEIKLGEDPNRYIVLFWAFLLALLPIALLALKGPFSTLQSVTVLGSLPLTVVITLEIVSFVRMVRQDRREKEAVQTEAVSSQAQ